ncbi:MAG: DUF5011 domain-containing protein, partial [Erysipelotrichaceae bacterium]|nr:DUF5011 domain-containing protein [Erysipelotrichaceae bacterium]
MSEKKTKAKMSTSRLITLCMAVTFLLAGAIYMALQIVPISVVIKGDKFMYVEVFSDYTEYGAVDRFTNEELTPVGQVDTSKVGTYFISYSTPLQTLKRIVKVVDTQAPVIAFDDPYDIYCTVNTELPEQGYTVTDNYDAELHNQTVMDSQVDITAIGDYEFTVEASDSSGNKAVAVKNVHVVEDDFHYLSKITNVDSIDEAMLQPVIDWMDLYYQSMKYLVPQDPSELFASDCQDRGYLSYKAFENIDAVRRSQKNDLYMDSCSYSLHLVSKTDSGNGITRLFFTEDCELQFRFLNGKTSQQGMIWNY